MKDSAAQVLVLDAKLKEVEVTQRQAEVTALGACPLPLPELRATVVNAGA